MRYNFFYTTTANIINGINIIIKYHELYNELTQHFELFKYNVVILS